MILFLETCKKSKADFQIQFHIITELILVYFIIEIKYSQKSYLERLGLYSIIGVPIVFLLLLIPDLIANWLKLK
jgi:hypothetical protein